MSASDSSVFKFTISKAENCSLAVKPYATFFFRIMVNHQYLVIFNTEPVS